MCAHSKGSSVLLLTHTSSRCAAQKDPDSPVDHSEWKPSSVATCSSIMQHYHPSKQHGFAIALNGILLFLSCLRLNTRIYPLFPKMSCMVV